MEKINENEKAFVKALVELEPTLYKVQQFLNETYKVDSYYDEEHNQYVILNTGINESVLDLAKAKDYAQSKIDQCMCEVVFKNA